MQEWEFGLDALIYIDHHQSLISRDMEYFYHDSTHSDHVSYLAYIIQIE